MTRVSRRPRPAPRRCRAWSRRTRWRRRPPTARTRPRHRPGRSVVDRRGGDVDQAGDARIAGGTGEDRGALDGDPVLGGAVGSHRVDGGDDGARTCTTEPANSASWKSPTHSSTPARDGAAPGRRTTARTVAPCPTSAAQVRDPTRPLAPVTTTTGGGPATGSLMRVPDEASGLVGCSCPHPHMRSAGASHISSSISSRSGMPWSPIGGISGFTVSLLSSTAPVRSRANRNPRRW